MVAETPHAAHRGAVMTGSRTLACLSEATFGLGDVTGVRSPSKGSDQHQQLNSPLIRANAYRQRQIFRQWHLLVFDPDPVLARPHPRPPVVA
jgi:hypothetical protein